MKSVKLMLVVLSMIVVTSINAQPQHREPKSADEVAKMMTERMTKSLKLSDNQAAKIYDVNLKYIEERHAKVEAMKLGREDRRAENREKVKDGDRRRKPQGAKGYGDRNGMAESRKAMTKEIVSVLNDDQIVEYIEMRSKMASRQSHCRGAGHPKQAPICKKR